MLAPQAMPLIKCCVVTVRTVRGLVRSARALVTPWPKDFSWAGHGFFAVIVAGQKGGLVP
jgi:hypothetical protein